MNAKEAELVHRIEDPTRNVQTLIDLASKHERHQRAAEVRRIDELVRSEIKRLDEQVSLRAEHATSLASAEAKRIDAIRAVDVSAVAVANERATQQAAVLAAQVQASAETLRSLVSTTATATAQQLTQLTAHINDRLSALEKSQYESKGSGSGRRDMGNWVVGGLMLLVAVATFMISNFQHVP